MSHTSVTIIHRPVNEWGACDGTNEEYPLFAMHVYACCMCMWVYVVCTYVCCGREGMEARTCIRRQGNFTSAYSKTFKDSRMLSGQTEYLNRKRHVLLYYTLHALLTHT